MDESIREVAPPFDDLHSQSSAPSAREWRLHGGLFILTVLSTIFAGMALVADVPFSEPPLRTPVDYILYLPLSYLYSVGALIKYAIINPDVIVNGATFSASLLAILFSHEMGHYLACRYYGVDATLPYFLPAPPYFVAGTFGAFIKIKSQIPTRRALFDIGLAGPLAGFVVAIPISLIGLATITPSTLQGSGIYFNDPLFFRIIARVLRVNLETSSANPYYMAAWLGLLVTSLNLMPVGQLDGGHGTFAVFGERTHKIIGRAAFASMAVLAVLGFWWHGSPSGFLYTVLLGIMLKVKHPQPPVMEPLGTKRVVIGILTLIVFALCFWPFPITIK